ncbi:hypothetical protein KC332_g478 [Hortaea werneckii]|uniref:BZIP domain-containing protein n=1 Tax=Hortaea werneckii TaxID=91943 RepID=A0A3M7JB24_HORWE|nr:hypothetical protein KC350_g2736 [Hortaea werneckii]KAI6850618.1 hypothetical protein KC358_g602 [Hortaea werneckii]KAI6944645.1 hypothetical protein KC341_g662 [Hortaea werneckii]KAI6950720.1 hypothetical protein KC348_g505 [Hortaea werneckii]KAI6982710.1 hypothetical protein KC321_g489 [Hortaea werneckii]
MTDEEQTSAQRTANLARIRDNQRRSRARRKEYLQELETKYRTCEQVGVEASAEIQSAARRVLDENKRLRQLLKQQGLNDAEIDGMQDDKADQMQYPNAASALEGMIGQRKACGSGDGGCGSGNTTPPQERSAAQTTIIPKSEPMSAPPQYMGNLQPAPRRSQPVQPQPPRLTPQHSAASNSQPYSNSPHSNSSSGVQTPTTAHFMQPLSVQTQPNQQPQIGLHRLPHDYSIDFNDTMGAWDAGQYQNGHNQHTQDSHWTEDQQFQGMHLPQREDSSSCFAAAGAIRTIKPDLGYELETELGCGDGADCVVPNARIFNMMDRYAEGV